MTTPDPTNRYRKPEKRAAYEDALRYLQCRSLLITPHLLQFTQIYIRMLHQISPADAKQVAAKALRVERGRTLTARQQEQQR